MEIIIYGVYIRRLCGRFSLGLCIFNRTSTESRTGFHGGPLTGFQPGSTTGFHSPMPDRRPTRASLSSKEILPKDLTCGLWGVHIEIQELYRSAEIIKVSKLSCEGLGPFVLRIGSLVNLCAHLNWASCGVVRCHAH